MGNVTCANASVAAEIRGAEITPNEPNDDGMTLRIPARLRGFTLIELMIVIAIIAIIAAIAIPSLLNARKSAIETQAIGLCRTAVTVSEQYRTRFGRYPSSAVDLGMTGYVPNWGPGFLDEYVIDYLPSAGTWTLTLIPVQFGVTADRSFYVDATGVIRVSASGAATSTSTPLE